MEIAYWHQISGFSQKQQGSWRPLVEAEACLDTLLRGQQAIKIQTF
jgi:hypothetical protein